MYELPYEFPNDFGRKLQNVKKTSEMLEIHCSKIRLRNVYGNMKMKLDMVKPQKNKNICEKLVFLHVVRYYY